MKRTLLLTCMLMIVYLQYGTVLFYDDFNRANGAVGNSWTNISTANTSIDNNTMKIVSDNGKGIRRDFTAISSGIYYVQYDWKIASNDWYADAFPTGAVTHLIVDDAGNLCYDVDGSMSDPITMQNIAFGTWNTLRLKVNIDTDRFSVWVNNTLVADNLAGTAVTSFTRFTFRAGLGAFVTQYVDNFIVYNETPPATPTNLTPTGAVNNITLNWTGTTQDFLTYMIYRKTTSPADVFLAEVPGTQTTYVDNTAAANTDYFYRVKAVSMTNIESGFSNEVKAHLQPDIAVTPQLINLSVGQGYTGETSFTIQNNGNYPLNWSIPVTNPIPTNGLLAYYPFDGNTLDVSGNSFHGTNYGATQTTNRFGVPNSAFFFDGINDYVTIPNTYVFNQTGDASMSFWMKKADEAKRTLFWGKNDDSDTNRFHVFTGNSGQGFQFDYRTPTGTLKIFSGTHMFTVDTNVWTNIVISRSGNTYTFYKNGTVVTSITDSSPYLPTSSGTWRISNGIEAFRYFYGGLDDICFYNRALSVSDVSLLYNSCSTPFLSINPVSGSIVNLGHSLVSLSFNAQNLTAGVYRDTLYVNSNDPDEPSIQVIVVTNVLPPIPSLSPSSFEVQINATNSIKSIPIQIHNTGSGILQFQLIGGDNVLSRSIIDYSLIGMFRNHQYYLSNNTSTWTDAKLSCISAGGHLATITSQVENDFISSCYASKAWIGLTDEEQEGVFKWVTNEPFSYSNWWSGQPDDFDGGEDYGEINYGTAGYWNDQKNNHSFDGIPIKHILEIEPSNLSSMLSFPQDAGYVDANSSLQIIMYVNGDIVSDGAYNTNVAILSDALAPLDNLVYPIVVKVDKQPPVAPVGLTFDEVQSDMNQIYLSWTANALADSVYSYKIWRRGVHDTMWSLKGTVDADTPWFNDYQFTGLDTTAVYYRITAVDWVDNESPASDEVMAWLQRFPAPTGLTMEIIRNRHVKLTWNPVTLTLSGQPGTPSCYVIYRSNTPSPIEDFYFVGAVDATTFTHSWAAWFIEENKQFYVVTAYSGSFEDLRVVAESRKEWRMGELNLAIRERSFEKLRYGD